MMRGRPATLSADEQYCQELTRREGMNMGIEYVSTAAVLKALGGVRVS